MKGKYFFLSLLGELPKWEANEGEAAAETTSKQQLWCEAAGQNHSRREVCFSLVAESWVCTKWFWNYYSVKIYFFLIKSSLPFPRPNSKLSYHHLSLYLLFLKNEKEKNCRFHDVSTVGVNVVWTFIGWWKISRRRIFLVCGVFYLIIIILRAAPLYLCCLIQKQFISLEIFTTTFFTHTMPYFAFSFGCWYAYFDSLIVMTQVHLVLLNIMLLDSAHWSSLFRSLCISTLK